MSVLEMAWLLSGFVLLLVGLALGLQYLEAKFPAFSRFLDRHVGEEPEWRRWS